MPLTFTDNAIHDADRMTVNFEGFEGGERVLCRVSREALDDLYAPNSLTDPISVYRQYAPGIQAIASRKYDRREFEAGRVVLVRSGDL